MMSKKLADLVPETRETKYRTSDEIFEQTQKSAGGVKRFTGEVVHPRRVPVSGGAGAYNDVRDRCYHHYIVAFAGQGIGFECYEPAYQLGAELAASADYGDKLWVDIEHEVEMLWNGVNPHSWETFRIPVVHGWNQVQAAKIFKKR